MPEEYLRVQYVNQFSCKKQGKAALNFDVAIKYLVELKSNMSPTDILVLLKSWQQNQPEKTHYKQIKLME